MKLRVPLLIIAATLGWPLHAGAADPGATGAATPALEQPASNTTPAVVERPKPVESPKPAEKPRPVTEKPQPAPPPPQPATVKPQEAPSPPVTAAAPEPKPVVEAAAAVPTAGGFSVGCWSLSFAMLVIGFVAGFIGRHFWSRRQLGGMTVRIGTWRGIP